MTELSKEEIEILEDSLDDIKPEGDALVNRRINHRNFAITIRWACIKSLREQFIYASELAEFLVISQARANQILNDLVKAGRFKKRFPTSNLVEYVFVLDVVGVPIIRKDFERANKTLRIKVKISLEQEE